MDINRANLGVLFQGLSTQFQLGLNNPPALQILAELVTPTGSMTAAELFGFLLRTTAWKVWPKGTDRQMQNVKSDYWRIEVETFEDSVRIPFQDIMDDHLGLYSPLVQQMGYAWVNKKIARLCNLIIDNTDCCIRDATTGAYTKLFANTHAYGVNNVDNLDTLVLDRANYVATRQAMQAWLYANNDPMGAYPSVLLCGPALQDTAQQLFNAQLYLINGAGAGAVSNILVAENLIIIVRPEFNATAGVNHNVDAEEFWCLLDTRQPLRPFVYINRMEANILGPSDPEFVLRTGNADFLGTARGEFSPTFPHLCYLQAHT